MLAQLQEENPDDVRVVFRHFPLPSHTLALKAAYATEAAGLQGKFWEMHDVIFAKQEEFSGMTEDQFQEWLVDQAKDLKLDTTAFTKDIQSEAVTKKVDDAQQHGLDIGIPGTPLLLLNGQYYQGPRDLENLRAILGLFQLEDRQYTACPPMVIDIEKDYTATIKTEKGDVVVQLFDDEAPMAVNNFVFLSREGWYDGVTFHRVLQEFVAQAGDPSGTGFGGPGYSFDNENTSALFDRPGLMGMANAGPGSNGSQFFITFKEAPDLNGNYTIFGEVIEGMDVLASLTERNPAENINLPPGDKIEQIEISER